MQIFPIAQEISPKDLSDALVAAWEVGTPSDRSQFVKFLRLHLGLGVETETEKPEKHVKSRK
jgi:hypothetical protein